MGRPKADDLHRDLLAGVPDALAPELAAWLAASRRFAAFAEGARSKIRKKLRTAGGPESALDVRLEFETAYRLLQERAFSVVYEPQAPDQPRRPDFAVSYTTHSTFMLEVTRVRGGAPGPERLADTVAGKLGQLVAGRSNVLLVGFPAPVTDGELRAVMTGLRRRAEAHDAALLSRSSLQDWKGFFRFLERLSEVLVRPFPQGSEDALAVWVNPQAKQPLTSKVRTALYRSQTGKL